MHVAARRSCRASLGCASICDVRVARVHATCSSGGLRVNLLRPHRRQSMHVLRDGHGSASALHPGHMPHGHVCACDGQGTLCASHPELMLCVHVCASRRTRHCVCFASGTRAEQALEGKRKGASDSVSALYVPSQRITPSLLALSSFFELRDLTLLSLSPKELRTRVTLSVMPSYYGVYGREE